MITVEQSTENLRKFVSEIEGKELGFEVMLRSIEYCQSQLSLAKNTGADKLIQAWQDMLDSLEGQHRAGGIGLVSI